MACRLDRRRCELRSSARSGELLHPWCHNQGKDSCSQGLRNRKTGFYEHDVFGVELLGCPLEERISEMNLARAKGHAIRRARDRRGTDNPLCAATGSSHLQRPAHESLHLSEAGQSGRYSSKSRIMTHAQGGSCAGVGGSEIYALLTRWNPAQFRQTPSKACERAARFLLLDWDRLVFSLAHHLLNDGHAGRGYRWPQNRAACARPVGRRSFLPPIVSSGAASRCWRNSRGARSTDRWRASAVSPSTVSPCGGTRTISQDH